MSYYTKITTAGLAAITAAMNNSSKVPITYMAFGDGNGYIPEPDENANSLVNEVYRVGVNKVEVHSKNPNWLVCEAIIPSAVGGFNIREVALYDSTGNTMLAIASYPPTYKPTVEEGAAKIQTIRIVIQVDNTGNFELIIDPDIVLATISDLNELPKKQQVEKIEAKLEKDLKSIWDFFSEEERISYLSNPVIFDAHRPLQEFFDYVCLNNVGTAYVAGSFSVSSSVKMGSLGNSATKMYDGYLTITAIAPIDIVVDFQLSKVVWSGGVIAICQGNGNWSSRTCRIGIALGSNADRLKIDWLEGRYAYETGVKLYDKTTLTNIGTIRSIDNGSGFYESGSVNYSLTANFTSSTRTGDANSTTQGNLLTVNVLPPENLSTSAYVVVDEEIYYIESIDRTTSTLTVYPWLKNTNQNGSLRYMFGGGVDVGGANSSVVSINTIDLMRNGIAYSARALYPPTAKVVTAQSNGLAVMVGNRPDGASVGGVITELYAENNNFDIAVVTRAASGFDIQNTIALNSAKFKYIAARAADGTISPALSGFFGVTIAGNVRNKAPLNYVPSSTTIKLGTKERLFSLRANNLTVKLEIDSSNNAAFGYDDALINIVGNNTTGIPTQVTFNPPAGYTVNGQASQVFANFISAAQFFTLCDFSRNNFIVQQVSRATPPQATATYDPPLLAATGTSGDFTTTTVTLAGAVIGDNVSAAFSRYNASVEISAQVSATDTVTVKFKNIGSTPVDLPSGILTVKAI